MASYFSIKQTTKEKKGNAISAYKDNNKKQNKQKTKNKCSLKDCIE